MTSQTHKRGNDPQEPLPTSAFQETWQYDLGGRVVGGMRLGGDTFSLTSGQSKISHNPQLTLSAEDAPDVRPLLTELVEEDARLQRAIDRCSTALGEPLEEEEEEEENKQTYQAEASYTNFDQREIEFRMNGFGQYISSVDRKGKPQSTFGRTQNGGQIAAQIDPLENVVCFQYDLFGNVSKQVDFPGGPNSEDAVIQEFVYAHTKANQVETFKDGVGRTTTRVLSDEGNVRRETITTTLPVPEGSPTTTFVDYTYYESGPADGLVQTMTDALGHTTLYEYDDYGRLEKTTYVDGAQEIRTYEDLTGNLSSIQDPDGFVTSFTYDDMNRLKTTSVTISVDAVTYTETFEYDHAGNQTRMVDRNEVRPRPNTTRRTDPRRRSLPPNHLRRSPSSPTNMLASPLPIRLLAMLNSSITTIRIHAVLSMFAYSMSMATFDMCTIHWDVSPNTNTMTDINWR